MPEPDTAAAQSSAFHPLTWISRARLIALFWVGTVLGLSVMAYTGHVGWDSHDYQVTIQDLRQGIDPYAKGIAATVAFQKQYVPGTAEHLPVAYHYPPITLPLLRSLERFPGWALGLFYGGAIAIGALLQLWAGLQMADKYERRWLALALPAIPFFPGLITDDVILSGNVAFILYGVILAAAVQGWKRNNWIWYYVAIVVASACKLPFLSLLAFPVLMDRRQWIPSIVTACAGVLIFAAQARLWPNLFREYVVAIRMMLDWKREFGYGPAGILGKALLASGHPSSHATAVFHMIFAGVLGIFLLFLSFRVRKYHIPPETWVPVALIGTLLLGPRLMRYDLAAISVPMLLIAGRTLRHVLQRPADEKTADSFSAKFFRLPILVAAVCFLIPNVLTITGPFWFPGETLVLLAVFSMGIWSIIRVQSEEKEAELA